MSSPAEQWAQAVAGDSTAFGSFYERHANRVYSHCYNRLRAREAAEDVTAEVFVLAWRRRERIRLHGQADILPWLLGAANNLLADQHRRSARNRRLLWRLPRPEPEPDIAEDLAEQDEMSHRQERALEVVRGMPRRDREVIELCLLDGVSPAAVAGSLGIPVSTVRSRLARALVKAREGYHSGSAARDGDTSQAREVVE